VTPNLTSSVHSTDIKQRSGGHLVQMLTVLIVQ